MMQRSRLSLAVSAAIGALGLSGAAIAQTPAAAPAATPQKLDRVEVTGSLIRRIEAEQALPITTIDIEEAQKQGVTNAEQSLRLITQNNSGGAVTSGSVSANNGAASYASLRALGAQRTLVLLNGKRIINNPNGTVSVDLNVLPSVALERVEVLSDGASSIYGTDAIAGVINYITRKTYQGITVGAEAQIPQRGGGEVYVGNVLAGWGNLATQGWNVFGGVNYRVQQPLQGNERDFMATSYIPSKGFDGTSPTTFPGNYSQTFGTPSVTTINNTNPSLPGCFPPSSIRVGNNSFCSADTQLWTEVIPKQEQTSAFLRGSLALGQNNTLALEYFWAQNVVTSQIAPSPEGALTMRNNNPFFPGNGITPITNPALNPAQAITVGWRTTALGPRQTEITNDTQRAVLSLDGSAGNWDYSANLLWSTAKVESQFLQGYGNRQAIVNGMSGAAGAPFLNPFGSQTPQGQAYLQANQVLGQIQDITGTMWGANGVVSTSFGNLPGGAMQAAVGVEYRSEDNTFKTDTAKASQSSSSGLAGAAPLREGDRNVWAIGLEMNFPILRNLDVGFSVRYDDYSDFGGTTNPKIAVKYQPIQQLLLRGSYNTGFAAPTLAQLYAPNSTTFTAGRYNDPVLCPGGVPNTAAGAVQSRDCGIQFQQLQGGNTQLQPEKSDAWTVGFVLQPVTNLTFGIDYWNYVVTDNLSTLGETTIFADPAKYANLFVRCSAAPPSRTATIPGCQSSPGRDGLAYIVNTQQNLGDTKTSGLDFSFNFNTKPESWGALSLGVRSTYILNYEFQVEPNGQWYNPVGNFNAQFGGPVLRYQQVTTFGWTMGPWSALLSNRYQSGYFDQNPASSVSAGFRQNSVGAWSVWNLAATWTGWKGLTLQAGVLNLFDAEPPYSNQTLRFQARAYDDRFSNPLGRTWQLAARYEFK